MTGKDFALYAATVLAWGFSWYAIKLQSAVSPEVSLFWRFVIATTCMFVWAGIGRHPLRFPVKTHLKFAALGVTLFSTNFLLFYYGAKTIPSGLLSVIFSLASVFNLMIGFLIFGQKLSPRIMAGGLAGFTGVALMFWPQISSTGFDSSALFGLALCVGGTLCFCSGNMVSARLQAQKISVVSATSWGMVYGTLALGVQVFLKDEGFQIAWTYEYVGSLIYLAVIASVVAFGSYLTLLGRIGSARAGYATVMFPVIALGVSTFLEGYIWTIGAIAGLLCVLAGNILVLTRKS